MIKNTFLLIAIIVSIVTSSCSVKNEPTFSISGTIPILKNKELYLSKTSNNASVKNDIIDTLIVDENGSFYKDYNFEPAIYELRGEEFTMPLAIDNGQQIVIEGSLPDDLIISGSIDTQLLQQYEVFRNESLNRLVKSVRNEIKTKTEEQASIKEIAILRELEVENYNEHIRELTNFVKTKMGTSIAILGTESRWKSDVELEFLEQLVLNFEKKYPQLEATKNLKTRISLLKKSSLGSVFETNAMLDNNGVEIELKPENATYTLIDLWASWCPPCRTESSLLADLYKIYQDKGFEIYGISLDTDKDRWIQALESDKRTWPNVSSLEGFNSKIATEYGISSLPTNYLIDSSGKIIAINLHGKKLKEKLDNLYK